MKYLYNEEEFYSLKQKISFLKFLYIFIICTFVVIEGLLIIFASFEKKIIFMIFSAFDAVLSVFSFIYLFDKRKYLIVIYSEFATILNNYPEKKEIEIIENPSKTITLSDSTCVYEIICKIGEEIRTIYFSSIFENVFDVGKTYKILEYSNYIVGYEDEN